VCRSKHVDPSKNFGIINSITKLHLVGISAEHTYKHLKNSVRNTTNRSNGYRNSFFFCNGEVKHACPCSFDIDIKVAQVMVVREKERSVSINDSVNCKITQRHGR